ncbi:E3 ubiquitin-protein ligase RNF213-like [Daphnia pulicaria]|uniref:E3 ubiquitin-protein ligase RNF213-like n=1 Tax=Daphnia pulicaria TaxID=35523 RepID=UPI001EEB30B4|nr:E3 ubiquitin-protein ligase RNF213-like [Daphnia pulicaria]
MLTEGNKQKAADLSIYLVYAFRFREREIFLENVFGNNQSASNSMTNVSIVITKMLYEKAHGASIGSGAIALNDALCENLFALYVCVLNGIFLIIVGRPGSSKSLSVEILKLVLSPGNFALRQELGDLPALRELYFQCSPMSTSSGFKALFESAQ